MPKPTTYTHYVKEKFHHHWIALLIYTLTNYTTAKCWWVCFCCGLFLRPIRCLWVLRCPLNATGWPVQLATLLEITTRLVDYIGRGFSYILWQFECNLAFLWAISPWKLLSSAVTHHFVVPHHPHPPPLYTVYYEKFQSRKVLRFLHFLHVCETFSYESSRWRCSSMDLRESTRDSVKVFHEGLCVQLATKLFCRETFMVYSKCLWCWKNYLKWW